MEKIIYLAGGCFWGVQEYYSRLKGIIQTRVGYANGDKENPTYQEVCSNKFHHAETVEIKYDDNIISLEKILMHFLRFVNPYSLNQQGEDKGEQYRSGVYYIDDKEKDIIKNYFDKNLKEGYLIQIMPLNNFYQAEEYHQDYLKKNINGYCHINLNLIKDDEKNNHQ